MDREVAIIAGIVIVILAIFSSAGPREVRRRDTPKPNPHKRFRPLVGREYCEALYVRCREIWLNTCRHTTVNQEMYDNLFARLGRLEAAYEQLTGISFAQPYQEPSESFEPVFPEVPIPQPSCSSSSNYFSVNPDNSVPVNPEPGPSSRSCLSPTDMKLKITSVRSLHPDSRANKVAKMSTGDSSYNYRKYIKPEPDSSDSDSD